MGFFQGCRKGCPMMAHGVSSLYEIPSKFFFTFLRKFKGMESTQLLEGKEAQWGGGLADVGCIRF